MKNKNKSFILLGLLSAAMIMSCSKKDLDVTNLNQPSYGVLNSESGILSYAKGFYKIGFGDQSVGSLDDGLGFGMLLIVQGFHEGMGDNIFVPWGNNSFKFADNPLSVKLDDGSIVNNPIGQGQQRELQLRNSRAYGASNSFLPEWTYMYFLNNSSNVLLSLIDKVNFTGDAATKKKVLQAWAYWWKGYAYSRIGSMYIAGLKIDAPNATNGTYMTHDALITEANANLDKAAGIIGGLSSGGDFDNVMTQIIPGYMQFLPNGSAGIPTPASWVKNINSLKARNLLVNKRTNDMTASDWGQVLNLANAGVSSKSDYVFLAKTYSDQSKSIFSNLPEDGTCEGYAASSDNNTFFISERLIQDYNTGDKRLSNNFDLLPSPVINKRGRSITFGTRYYMIDGGTGNGAITYYSSQPNVVNSYISCSYEENQLMKAEALINTGQIVPGLLIVDGVRTLQGAGVPSVSGLGLSLLQAKEELRKERRCALLFRGVAFYDLRRMGMADDVSKGGGRNGCVVLDRTGKVNTNATINYSYMSYWDVPQNELDFNPAASGSAPVKNQ
ncbi:RagB/SusD family nutrient uptake outer membrane protein [Asinibacterium sp. OR53]|uniref:RagB/SusD family nutrient uptake outer membrane protein n=1 Tax=Asinibacterium sp. OR53 TaxID=925409 RepID=UPI00047AC03E|nr:RagB/SusD family nutrient uptake outer membrane protein [Asinibacterium sp. OR53]